MVVVSDGRVTFSLLCPIPSSLDTGTPAASQRLLVRVSGSPPPQVMEVCPGDLCSCLDPQVDSAFLEKFCSLYLQHSLCLLRKGLELVGTEKNDHKVSGTRSIVHSSFFIATWMMFLIDVRKVKTAPQELCGSRKRSVYWGTDDPEWLVNQPQHPSLAFTY